MGNIGLIRVDDRLIHGQVVTSWITQTRSTKIIIIDDELYANDYMKGVFAVAAPRGISVDVMKAEQAANAWKENQFNNATVLILLKKISTLKNVYEKGFEFDSVQIGGLASGPGKKLVVKAIALSDQDAADLKQLIDYGVDLYIQSMPGEKKGSVKSVLEKHFKKII